MDDSTPCDVTPEPELAAFRRREDEKWSVKGDPTTDPIGTVRDMRDPHSPIADDDPIAHVERYAIKWCSPLNRDEEHPWLILDSDGPQRMPNDLMDRYPVVPLDEVARRLGHCPAGESGALRKVRRWLSRITG